MPTEKQRHTFISYSRINKEFALQLAKELRTSGFNIWFDQLDIPTGARWDDEIERALEECEIFMVILTPASSNSDNVKDEIGYAIDTNKRILPVLLENANVPLRLRRFQYVDFTSKSYEEGVESAKQLLRKLIEESTVPKTETPAMSQARKVEAERTGYGEADHMMSQKAETDRLAQAKPVLVPRTNTKARAAVVPKSKKKPVIRVVIIGVFALTALAVCGIGGVILYGVLGPANNPSADNPPAVKTAASPTPIPTPIMLDTSEAEKIIESGGFQGIFMTATEQYTADEINSFIENSQAIPVMLTSPSPIAVGYISILCATTKDILQENLAFINFIFKLDDSVASGSNYVDVYDTSSDGLECFSRSVVIDKWTSGKYTIYQEITLTQKINNGESDQDPFKDSQSYVVTVP